MTPNAASVVLRAWVPRLLLIAAAALFGLALSSGSAHADSLLDPVGHTADRASHDVSKATTAPTHRVAGGSAIHHATSTAAISVRRSAGSIPRVKQAATVARTRHALRRNLPSTQGITARATRLVRAATAQLGDVTHAQPVVLGTVGAPPLPVVGVALPALGGKPFISATTAERPTTLTAADHRAARVMTATVHTMVDQLRTTGSTRPPAMSAQGMLALGAVAAASSSLSPAAAGGAGFALVPAPLRLDTGGHARRYGIPSRQSPFRTPPRPGFFPA